MRFHFQVVNFSGYCRAEKRNRNKTTSNTIKLLVLTEILSFSLQKHSLDCCEPLVNFQGSEKVNSDTFARLFGYFYGGISRSP